MNKQFSFYLTPNDFLNLERALRKVTQILIFSEESKDSKPLELPSFEIDKMGKDNLAVYLTCRGCDGKMFLDKIEKQKIWIVDSLCSPVIELSRCFFDGNILRAGRMYYTTGYYLEDGFWTDKDSKFLEWAKKVFAVAKRNLKRKKELDAYFGKEALQLYGESTIRLV